MVASTKTEPIKKRWLIAHLSVSRWIGHSNVTLNAVAAAYSTATPQFSHSAAQSVVSAARPTCFEQAWSMCIRAARLVFEAVERDT